MKKLFVLVGLLISIGSQAQIGLGGYIVPFGDYPTHLDTLQMGGFMTFESTSERNSITILRRKIGTVVYTRNDNSFWQLIGGLTNGHWVKIFEPYTYKGIDTLYRKPGIDSIFWKKNGQDYSIIGATTKTLQQTLTAGNVATINMTTTGINVQPGSPVTNSGLGTFNPFTNGFNLSAYNRTGGGTWEAGTANITAKNLSAILSGGYLSLYYSTAADIFGGLKMTLSAGDSIILQSNKILYPNLKTGSPGTAYIDSDGSLKRKADTTLPAPAITPAEYARLFNRQVASNPTGTITINVDLGAQYFAELTSTGARTLAFSNLRLGDLIKLAFNNTSGGTITLTLPSNSFVQGIGSAPTVVIPVGKSMLSLSEYGGTNYWFTHATY